MPRGNPATLKHYQPKWKSGATRTIRVPIALVDDLLDIAHKLDTGDSNHLLRVNGDTKIDETDVAQDSLTINHLSQVQEAIMLLNEALTFKANAGGKIKSKIRQALELLNEGKIETNHLSQVKK